MKFYTVSSALCGYIVKPNLFSWKIESFWVIIFKILLTWSIASGFLKQNLFHRRALISRDRHKISLYTVSRARWGYNVEPNFIFWYFEPFWVIISKILVSRSIASRNFNLKLFCGQGKAGLWFPLKFKGTAFFGKGVINMLKIKIQLIFDSIFYFLATKYQLI